MSLKIYNTLTGGKEVFAPINPPKVGMYVCGVTVYDLCHIGHARSTIVFDIIYRYLKFSGYDVTYVRNFTDVDDKIINRANELGIKSSEVAARYIDEFNTDMGALGLARPDVEPRATGHIPEMLEIIESLIEKGKAYELNGSVYFSVRSFPEYGALSKRNIDDLRSGARVDVDDTKKDPLDFALWKASKPGEPEWESPWGMGRPGWHIECSAMGRKYLGVTFDIHGGGKDLVFPHHENEIAQSHASSGSAPVKVWVHNGFVNINSEKMSKSLGNFSTIKDILKQYHPEAVRYFLLTSHYRSPIDFSPQAITDAHKNLARFYDLLSTGLELGVTDGSNADPSMVEKFRELMDDDFNTATALSLLLTELKKLNHMRDDMAKMKKKSDDYKNSKEKLLAGIASIKTLGGVLGLFGLSPDEFIEEFKSEKLKEIGMSADQLDATIKARAEARKEKDFKLADTIRAGLDDKGIKLSDTPEGVKWSVSFD